MMKDFFDKELYDCNRLYILFEEQELTAECKLCLGEAGLESNIEECALRLRSRNICIIGGDRVI